MNWEVAMKPGHEAGWEPLGRYDGSVPPKALKAWMAATDAGDRGTLYGVKDPDTDGWELFRIDADGEPYSVES